MQSNSNSASLKSDSCLNQYSQPSFRDQMDTRPDEDLLYSYVAGDTGDDRPNI
jgi:hypothetical protein